MVPKLFGAGKSFKGLAAYILHDSDKAKTSERVAWTHTLNMTADTPLLAVDEMLWVYRAAEELKREAGIKAGGRALENPVRHFSLNWHPSEAPSREHMVETVEQFLAHMKWSEHQALIVCHADKQPHVHVMLCGVHPETGRALDTSFEKRRAQEWALAYERERGLIFCDERLKPLAERTPSPTRATWQQLRTYDRDDGRGGQEFVADFDYVDRGQDWKDKEWKLLKGYQKEQRKEFFAGGKEAYRAQFKEATNWVRGFYKDEWRDYYKAKRTGADPEELAEKKADILERQTASVKKWCEIAASDLKGQRDCYYENLRSNGGN